MSKFILLLITALLILSFPTQAMHIQRKCYLRDQNIDIQRYAPTLCYDYKENYFPVDVHGDDYNVTNNHENYERGLFSDKPVCYYNVVSYDGFKVYEYWFYYAYNDYNYYSIKINDIHEHDFESVFVWVDEDGYPFYVATSMHLWIQRYQYDKENHPFVYVERGGHGMSLNKKLIDGIPMVFEKPGRILEWSDFIFKDFSDLISYSDRDLDSNGYYKTDEVAKVRVKAPWLREVFKDPDVLRKSKNNADNIQIETQKKTLEIAKILPKFKIGRFTLLSSFLKSRYLHRDLRRALLQIAHL